MPNSTRAHRIETLAHVLSAVGPLRFTDSEIDLRSYAAEALQVAGQGGWHFVHADDLPAGYTPGDVLRHISGPRELTATDEETIRQAFLNTYTGTGLPNLANVGEEWRFGAGAEEAVRALNQPIGNPLPEPTAVLGESMDEMRRRLPTTDPTPSRDTDPFARSPQEPTQADVFTRDEERDARIRALERITESAGRQLSDLHADSGARFQQVNELANRIDALDQALSTITERTDDNEQRTDTLSTRVDAISIGLGDLADRHNERLNTLEDEVFNEVRSRLQTLEAREYHAPTEAPHDDDARLGGHDTTEYDEDGTPINQAQADG